MSSSISKDMLKPALVLGLLSCVGPFAVDMYLPALPAIAADLKASIASTQGTLTSFFVAFGMAQLVYGPLADEFGRKPPLYAGLAILILASLACAFAPSIFWLEVCRFFQGAGAAVVMVIPRAIIRDLYTGVAATRLMSLIMLVISVSPMLAPLTGSGLIAFFGWQSIFVVLAGASLCSLIASTFVLPETLREENRVPFSLQYQLGAARALMADRFFLSVTFVAGFGMASFFVYIASASFVYTQQFGLSAMGFSLAFAFNALAFFSASQLAAPLGEKYGLSRLIAYGMTGHLGFLLLLLVVTLLGLANLYVIVGLFFCASGCFGVVMPTAMVLALEDHGENAGLASSIGGTLQMLAGSVIIVLAGPFFDGTALPMVAAMAICSAAAFALSHLSLRTRARAMTTERV